MLAFPANADAFVANAPKSPPKRHAGITAQYGAGIFPAITPNDIPLIHPPRMRSMMNPTLRLRKWFCLAPLYATLLHTAVAGAAAGNSVLTGTIIDAASQKPIANAVVTITSPAIQGEQVLVTDAAGTYRLPQLPPGEYTVTVDDSEHKPSSRSGLTLRTNSTIRLNLALLPENLTMTTEVAVKLPTVDIGSSTTGLVVDSEMAHRLAVAPPGGRTGAVRSFESLGTLAPGAIGTNLGPSFSGSSAPENRFQIDGVSVGSAKFGINDTPLSLEFVKEVNVATGGYMPEFGRTTGGVFDVVTKSGGNEFHGSIFGSIAPGVFEGQRNPVRSEGTVVAVDQKLRAIRDFGFDLGGPIQKDRLWFYAGLNVALQDLDVTRSLNRLRYATNPDGSLQLDANGNPISVRDEYGFQQTDHIAGADRRYVASKETLQYIGKLTWAPHPSHTLTLSVFGSPSWSGGDGSISLGGLTGNLTTINTNRLEGQYAAFGRKESAAIHTVSLKLFSAFLDRKLMLDAALGYHRSSSDVLPVDGVGIAGGQGLDKLPGISWGRGAPAPHTIADFENLPANSGCEPAGATTVIYCPVQSYLTGGPGNINQSIQNRFQGRAVLTYVAKALGQHILKAGLDVEVSDSTFARANSGGVWFRESYDGDYWQVWHIGSLTGPNDVYVPQLQSATTYSTIVGGFVQDSFTFLDRFTVNAGVRYDAQMLSSSDGMGTVLPNQWSPRIGGIYDPTGQGRSKIFANYARYYENVPLNLADTLFVHRPFTVSVVSASACDPNDPTKVEACMDPKNRLAIGDTYAPNRHWGFVYGDRAPVDPAIQAQSMDEIVAGGEYQVFDDARIGVNYTHRSIVRVIEDMSRDEGTSYLVGNPGFGETSDFPKAERDYDALTLFFQKNFSKHWLAQASYTLSYLRGNYPGLANESSPAPNTLAEFDLLSILPNRNGPLPLDHRHAVKLFGAREFVFGGKTKVNLGVSYSGISGAPLDVLGSHPYYGAGAAFVLPRGAGGNLPWVHSVDTNLAVGYRLNDASTLSVNVDVFNLFNLQAVTGRDQSFTYANVRPISGGTTTDLPTKGETACSNNADCRYKLVNYEDGTPFDPANRNPNYGSPTSYQNPRTVRIGMRLTF